MLLVLRVGSTICSQHHRLSKERVSVAEEDARRQIVDDLQLDLSADHRYW